jgi:hypothetical protein
MFQHKLYDVVTLHECMQDPATLDWLEHANAPLPGTIPPGRYPTPAEISEVMHEIPGMQAEIVAFKAVWQVTVSSLADVSWAILAIDHYSGDPETPHQFSFIAGWDDVILLMTLHLVKVCGPLVLLHDSGAPPQVVLSYQG